MSMPPSLRPRPLSHLIHRLLNPPVLVALWLTIQSPAHAEVDASGCDAVRQHWMCFQPVPWQDNPLRPPIGDGYGVRWELGDLDGDGDLDVLVGRNDDRGLLSYAENIGTPKHAHFVQRGIIDLHATMGFSFGGMAIPSMADLDGDDDLDVVVTSILNLVYFENISTPGQLNFVLRGKGKGSPIVSINTGGYSKLTFSDLDNDGDLDLFTTENFTLRGFMFFENIGTAQQANFVRREGEENPLREFDGLKNVRAAAGDFDKDGDDDLWVVYSDEDYQRQSSFYANAGVPGQVQLSAYPAAQNPLREVDPDELGFFGTPALGDLDNDGDLDALFNNGQFSAAYYENIGTSMAQFTQYPFISSIFYGVETDDSPLLADLDTDGDLDLVTYTRRGYSTVQANYYENVGTPRQPLFTPHFATENPLHNVTTLIQDLIDLDKDGDLDALLTGSFYYENIGTPQQAAFELRELAPSLNNLQDYRLALGDIAKVHHL